MHDISIVVVEVKIMQIMFFELSTFARAYGKSARANVDSLCARLCVCVSAHGGVAIAAPGNSAAPLA